MDFYNFNGIPQNYKTYGGTAGIKIGITINQVDFILKYPGKLKDMHLKNIELSYSNSPICEYIGCKVYESIGIPVQQVFLGTRNEKTVVACKDFLNRGEVLIPYRDIKATFEPAFVDPKGDITNGTGTNIHEIIRTLHEHPLLISNPGLEQRFWDMFIVDALIGNPDRNNENWGLIRDINDNYRIPPVYDCGNCLNSKLSEEQVLSYLSDNEKMREISIQRPCIFERRPGKRINAYSYIEQCNNEQCNNAVIRIVPRIHLDTIQKVIQDIPDFVLHDVYKEFYMNIITMRKELVLEPTYERLFERNISRNAVDEHDDH